MKHDTEKHVDYSYYQYFDQGAGGWWGTLYYGKTRLYRGWMKDKAYIREMVAAYAAMHIVGINTHIIGISVKEIAA